MLLFGAVLTLPPGAAALHAVLAPFGGAAEEQSLSNRAGGPGTLVVGKGATGPFLIMTNIS